MCSLHFAKLLSHQRSLTLFMCNYCFFFLHTLQGKSFATIRTNYRQPLISICTRSFLEFTYKLATLAVGKNTSSASAPNNSVCCCLPFVRAFHCFRFHFLPLYFFVFFCTVIVFARIELSTTHLIRHVRVSHPKATPPLIVITVRCRVPSILPNQVHRRTAKPSVNFVKLLPKRHTLRGSSDRTDEATSRDGVTVALSSTTISVVSIQPFYLICQLIEGALKRLSKQEYAGTLEEINRGRQPQLVCFTSEY